MPKATDWITRFDYAGYWQAAVEGKLTGDDWTGKCPLHNDHKASFSASLAPPGLWTCHAGVCGSGNIVQFHAKANGLTTAEAEDDLRHMCGDKKWVPDQEVADRALQLLQSRAILDWLRANKGLTEETARKYSLGFDGKRIWIPVKQRGKWVNVRQYDYTGNAALDKYINMAGRGDARLFPWENLKGTALAGPLYLFEGEMKALLANQMGIPGVSTTGGAGTWKNAFTEYAEGRDVIICYDIDKPGRKAARELALTLLAKAKTVKVVDLPITEPANGDFNDYVVRHGHNLDDFMALVAQTPVFMKPKEDSWKADQQVYDCTLSQSSGPERYYKLVRVPITVAGKDLTPYMAPKRITLSCPINQGKKCVNCGLNQGAATIDIPPTSQDILKMIDCSDDDQRDRVRRLAQVVVCPAWKMRAEETYNVEELRVIPEVTLTDNDTNQYVARTVYKVGHAGDDSIKANRAYKMEAISLPHPSTQYATLIINKADAMEANFDKFQMDEEKVKRLSRVLCPEGEPKDTMEKVKALDAKLRAMTKDISLNVTKRYSRDDLVLVTLLTYASVRRFNFNGELVRKGWLESLILGDTRTAKTSTVQALLEWMHLGELCAGENSSLAGLLGGLSQQGSRWHLQWGKIPLNNGGLLVVDETSGLDVEALAKMSSVRSSGIAAINKVTGEEKTEAQTRLIWISNPRSGRSLETYTYGVHAVKELFGNAEDVARLDMAVTAASGEVPVGEINRADHGTVPHVHTPDVIRDAILWAWSRRPHEVSFTDEATQKAFEAANILAGTYSSTIPLVEGGEMRIKLAKMAVAAAVLTFSTTDGMTVVVEEEHVMWAAGFLDTLYSKPSMGYRQYSEAMNRTREVPSETRKEIIREFMEFPEWWELRDAFLAQDIFRKRNFLDQVGYEEEDGRRLWKWLNRRRLMMNKPIGFVKTPIFTEMLRAMPERPEKEPEPLPSAPAF